MVEEHYLLDTNVLIDMFNGKNGIQQRIVECGFENCYVSSISLAELYAGAIKGGKEEYLQQVAFVEEKFNILPFWDQGRIYGKLYAEMEKKGERLDDMDLLLAASAIEAGMTLVTANTKHFLRCSNLRIEDWRKKI